MGDAVNPAAGAANAKVRPASAGLLIESLGRQMAGASGKPAAQEDISAPRAPEHRET